MKTVTLEVTQKDIDRAVEWKIVRGSPGYHSCNCPVATAARRQFHNQTQVYSAKLDVVKKVKGKTKRRTYHLDVDGVRMMNTFDSGRYDLLKPCTVVLTKIGR